MESTENNTCITIQNYAPELLDQKMLQIFFSFLYFLVWVTAIVGNTLVLYVLSVTQVSLSVRTVFVGCLATSDLLMCLFSLPITVITTFTRIWVFPAIFCNIVGVFQGGSIFVSSFTLTVIALDRCMLILKPNKEMVNYSRAYLIVGFIWALGYSLALPLGVFSKITSYDDICGEYCEEAWPDKTYRKGYGLTVLSLQFGIPTIISSICYYMISQVMSSQLKRRRGAMTKLRPESEVKLVSRKTRANRMMIFMVVGFVLAWMPFNLINLYRDLIASEELGSWYSTAFVFCHVCAMCSAVVNPIIYSWFNPSFRTSILAVLKKYSGGQKGMGGAQKMTRPDTKVTIANGNDFQQGDQYL